MLNADRRIANAALIVVLIAADARGDGLPFIAGPEFVGGVAVEVRSASLNVVFGESGATAEVELTVVLAASVPGEAAVGFGVWGARSFRATVDGVEAPVSASPAPIAAGGEVLPEAIVVAVPVGPSAPATLVFSALCDAAPESRDPLLSYPQATFALNRELHGPVARVIRFAPGAALTAAGDFTARVETVAPRWPEGPVAGARQPTAAGEFVEGPVVADPAAPIEIGAIEGEYEAPRNWGVLFGVGVGLDWPRLERVERDEAGAVVATTYSTAEHDEVIARVWFRGLFQYAFGSWMFAAGLEGDWLGTLEVPLTLTWFPQTGHPSPDDIFADYRLFAGVAFQVLNDRSPGDYGFDPRVFVRLGGGVRVIFFTCEVAYEIAPPMGNWDGDRGGLEHKFLITFPWAL